MGLFASWRGQLHADVGGLIPEVKPDAPKAFARWSATWAPRAVSEAEVRRVVAIDDVPAEDALEELFRLLGLALPLPPDETMEVPHGIPRTIGDTRRWILAKDLE